MSALTTLFSSLANKIRSKTGGSDTYTPPEMVDAIDDVYDAGVASATTPITPSNASPASMTSGTGYKPTANGYAIESYNSVTPSGYPFHVITSGEIDKMEDSGYVVKDISAISASDNTPYPLEYMGVYLVLSSAGGYAIKSYPTSVTPSNSSPAGLINGKIYKMGGGGCAIASYDSITPSNSTPVSLSANSPVIPASSGYAIESYSSKTPSDTNPPSISSGAIIKAGSSGYLTKNAHPVFGGTPDKTYINNTAGTSGTATISVTKKPRYIVYSVWSRTSNYYGFTGIVDVEKGNAYRIGYMAAGEVSESWTNWGEFLTVGTTSVTVSLAYPTYNKRVYVQVFY